MFLKINKNSFYIITTKLIVFTFLLSACVPRGDLKLSSKQTALPTMENIALNSRSCWFRSKDKRFTNYRLAPELKSFSGRPRILIVPTINPNERPLLVIEATGDPAQVELYGPLMQTKLADKIYKDVKSWSKDQNICH